MHKDSVILIFSGLLVLFISITLEVLSRKGFLPQWIGRKLLHISAVSTCALVPLYLEDLMLLQWIVVIAELFLIYLVWKGFLFEEEHKRKSWGIALFPLPFLAFLFLFEEQRWLIAFPMLILAWSDALAAIIGITSAKRHFAMSGDPKSLSGSLAFFSTSVFLFLLARFGFFPLFPNWIDIPIITFLLLAILFSIILTAVEALGSQGSDNLFIPIAALLLFLRMDEILAHIQEFSVLVLIAGLFLFITIRKNSLSPSGAFTSAFMGISVAEFAGLEWLILPAVFFLSSTLIGRFFKGKTTHSDSKQGKARDAVQVVCNGGVYWVMAILLPYFPDFSLAMIVSMAIATSDTWASEIGIGLKGKTYDVIRWKTLPVGVSGGVSIEGSLAGLFGSLLIVLIGSYLFEMSFYTIVLLSSLGFVGMLLDSIIGSIFQAKYLSKAGLSDENLGLKSQLVSGFSWMSNDWVNLISNILITALSYSFIHMGSF
jgi:uncharacterized protein (TIGR00297 family)